VMQIFDKHPWPGNVRELRNAMERAVIVAKGDMIDVGDLPHFSTAALPAAAASEPAGLRAGVTVDDMERQLIEITLAHTNGNKTRAAEMLGISLKTLHNKLNRMKGDGGAPTAD
jgi:two-component system response regulator HydG